MAPAACSSRADGSAGAGRGLAADCRGKEQELRAADPAVASQL